jgi:hypothetical protein
MNRIKPSKSNYHTMYGITPKSIQIKSLLSEMSIYSVHSILPFWHWHFHSLALTPLFCSLNFALDRSIDPRRSQIRDCLLEKSKKKMSIPCNHQRIRLCLPICTYSCEFYECIFLILDYNSRIASLLKNVDVLICFLWN